MSEQSAPDVVFLSDDPANVIDTQVVAPSREPCYSCGAPLDDGDSFCASCGATAETKSEHALAPSPEAQKFFRCDNCGSEVAADPEQRSYVCAFCDSTYVAEFSPDMSQRQPPEFVIGFAVSPDRARKLFENWIAENGWIRPSNLQAQAVADKQRGVYVPFWSFSLRTESRWQSTIGEHWYRTETYRTQENGKWVTKTRRVQETEWWPLDGQHHRFYSGYLVSGSRGLAQQDAEKIKPFQLPSLKRYQPYYLAGWLSEEYSVTREQALDQCQREFYERERRNVAAFMPGDTHRDLDVQSEFSQISSDLCLLPVYIISYRYKKKLYRFLVNGQTGKIAGEKPVTYRKVALLIGAILLGGLAIFGAIALLGSVLGG
jgi:hypothetical protein